MPTKKGEECSTSIEGFKKNVASKLQHEKGAAWMAAVTSSELESLHGSSNRLFQFLIEGKKAKSLSFDLETLRAASQRGDLFTFRQCEKIEEVYREAEARFDEYARKAKAERDRIRANEDARRVMEEEVALMPLNSPVVLVNLTKDETLNRSMGTYEGRAPQGRHRVRLYKDSRLLSIKEENLCSYEDFLAQQDQANFESDGSAASGDDFSDDESSEDASASGEKIGVQAERQDRKLPVRRIRAATNEPLYNEEFSMFQDVIKAPSSRLGFLIGRKQSTLRHIKEETGVRSIAIGKEITNGTQEIVLQGGKVAVEMAKNLCMDILKAKGEIAKRTAARAQHPQPTANKTHPQASTKTKEDKDPETICIPVPQLVVKDLIGKKGANLLGITRSCRAKRISILEPIEKGLRQALIIGRPQAVKKAIKLIEDFCNDKLPGYKTTYGITEEDYGDNQGDAKKQRNAVDGTRAESDKRPCRKQEETINADAAQPREEDKIDPLPSFLTSQDSSFKCPPKDFHDWLRSEDVVSFEELAEAVEDPDFMVQMQVNGLKGFKRAAFVKAVHAQQTLEKPAVALQEPNLHEVPPELECPISHVLMVCDPVVASDGNVYERAAIEEWFERSGNNGSTGSVVRSPLTNEPLPNLNLMSVSMVRNMAKEFAFKSLALWYNS